MNVVFGLVASKWKPTILWRLAEGDHRFAQLRRAVGAVSEKVLAEQLRELERDGLVSRADFDGFPRRVEYRLTRAGRELDAMLGPVGEWGHRFAASRHPQAAGRT
ncbi:helix-turn-helix transcriptional regulator [Microbacterium lushaniae]|nr:helix-turn-helix transcriptional regulator [Microbacterium lushaniae]KAA9159267.1 helix-turn-helix transcriptional regulator [Microbacterium lushaniae]